MATLTSQGNHASSSQRTSSSALQELSGIGAMEGVASADPDTSLKEVGGSASLATPSPGLDSGVTSPSSMFTTSSSASPITPPTSSTLPAPMVANGGSTPADSSSATKRPPMLQNTSSSSLTNGLRSVLSTASAAALSASAPQSAAAVGSSIARPLSRNGNAATHALAGAAAMMSPNHWLPSLGGGSTTADSNSHSPGPSPAPLSSILLNPLPTAPMTTVAWHAETKDGRIHTKIPAVPSEKDKAEERARIAREKEKQREKEREAKEKELQREKEKEKVWGIPKKALMMGMSDINFNAQVAILGGWGNGSGTQTIVPVVDKKREREKELERKRMEELERQIKQEKEEKERRKKRGKDAASSAADEQDEDAPGEEDEILDPEELAAINAIINTRRSMEAAQALASGQVKMRRANSMQGSTATDPLLRGRRGSEMSQDSASMTGHSPSMSSSVMPHEHHGSSHTADVSSVTMDTASTFSHSLHGADGGTHPYPQGLRSPRIRFAAFPSAYDESDSESMSAESSSRHEDSGGRPSMLGAGLLSSGLLLGSVPLAQAVAKPATGSDDNGHVPIAEMDESVSMLRSEESTHTVIDQTQESAPGPSTESSPSTRRPSAASIHSSGGETIEQPALTSSSVSATTTELLTPSSASHRPASVRSVRSASSKTRASFERTDTITSSTSHQESEGSSDLGVWRRGKRLFNPNAYRALLSQKRKGNRSEDSIHETLAAPLVRRLSTGTLGVMSSLEATRKATKALSSQEVHSSGGKSSTRSHSRNRKSGSRKSRSRPSSRSGSGDEDERQRRRELILSARPGGTGMVTLLDGTKIKARRVGDPDVGAHDVSYDEWGYGLLAREARRSMALERGEGSPEGEEDRTATFDSHGASKETSLERLRRDNADADGDAASDTSTNVSLTRVQSNTSSKRTASSTVFRGESTPSGAATNGSQDSPRITTGLGLTAERAEEIRRRHEEEVAALGWEVVHNAHKQQAKRQASMSESAKTSGSERTEEDPLSQSVRLDAIKETATGRRVASESTARPHSPRTKDELRKVSSNTSGNTHEVPSTPSRVTRQRSRSSTSEQTTPAWSRGEKAALKSLLPVDNGKMVDPSISIPAPSPLLPRKPDAKGHMVVPLPLQELGRRPERPREGRSWINAENALLAESPESTDESDEDALPVAEQTDDDDTGAYDVPDGKDADDEEEESGLNAEEQAEEDRKTAIQKKRATTRAAGQEIVQRKTKSPHSASSVSKKQQQQQREHKSRNMYGPSVDDDDSFWEPARPHAGKSMQQLLGAGSRGRPGLLTADAGHANTHRARQAASTDSLARRGTSPSARPLRTARSTITPTAEEAKEVYDVDSDAELWAVGAVSSLGVVGGSVRGGRKAGKNVALLSQAQARAMRERRIREEKERERQRIEKLKKDDEHLDYGWPRSLKGSLY